MATSDLNKALAHIHKALGAPNGTSPTDKQLLANFVAARDESAFAMLVKRHGAMVLGVCRRVLRQEQDAEDAFQATFLVLARKASSARWRDTVAPWLYEVAHRTALEARAANVRRLEREKQVVDMPHPEVAPTEPQDWRPFLDQELGRLPEKYRAAIVLCDLEGKTRKEAARQLGVPEGTLSGRLTTARRMLAERLARHGLALSGGALATALSEGALAAVPPALVGSTARVAVLVAAGQLAAVATPAALLTQGVLKAMLMAKLKFAVATLMVVAAFGVGGLAYHAGPSPAVAQAPKADKSGKPQDELEALRKENELLRLNLQVVLEKVRAQESELRTIKAQAASDRAALQVEKNRLILDSSTSTTGNKMFSILDVNSNPYVPSSTGTTLSAPRGPAPDPLKEVESALKVLQGARDKEAKRRAADALEKAMKKLREQLK